MMDRVFVCTHTKAIMSTVTRAAPTPSSPAASGSFKFCHRLCRHVFRGL